MLNIAFRTWLIGGWIAILAVIVAVSVAMGANLSTTSLLLALGAAPAAVIPTSCPACQSSTIVTTAKSPDADSYWRCEHCGEVWNASRSQTDWYRGRRLR